MRRSTAIEAVLFIGVGVVGITEGVRLSRIFSNLYQMLGPGVYVMALSILLIVLGAAHYWSGTLASHPSAPAAEPEGANETRKVVGLVGLLCVNVFLIQLIGYEAACFVFFLVAFWILGVRSIPLNLAISLGMTAIFHLIFVEFCSVIFPSGLLFG